MRGLLLGAVLGLLLGLGAGCGPGAGSESGASLGATPAQVSAAHPTSVLTFIAWDAAGEPGVGTVHFSPTGGAILEGAQVELNGGRATATFRCLAPGDVNCSGAVQIDGAWKGVTRTVGVQVVP